MILRACLSCGTLSANSRCRKCTAARERKRYHQRPHYHGDYRRRAAEIRANAQVCWLCKQGPNPDDPWTADHIIPGDPNSPLMPAHRSCNSRRGTNPAVPQPN